MSDLGSTADVFVLKVSGVVSPEGGIPALIHVRSALHDLRTKVQLLVLRQCAMLPR
jgi:hypothetical protein